MFRLSRPKLDMFRPTRPKLPIFRLYSTEEVYFDRIRLRKNNSTKIDRVKTFRASLTEEFFDREGFTCLLLFRLSKKSEGIYELRVVFSPDKVLLFN